MDKQLRLLALIMTAVLVVFMTHCGYEENDDYDENGDDDILDGNADDQVGLFEAEGVAVVVPGKKGEVEVKKLLLGELEISDQDEFTPARPVIDIAFVGLKGDILTTIDAELYVLYGNEDLENAGGDPQNLALGFWDGKRWIRFTDDQHKFELRDKAEWPIQFFKLPEDAEGFASVRISNWSDRAIAWGRLRF